MTIHFEPLIKKKDNNNLHRRHYNAITKQRRNALEYPRVPQFNEGSRSETRSGKNILLPQRVNVLGHVVLPTL